MYWYWYARAAASRWPDRVLDDHARRITHNRQRSRPSRESIGGRTWHTPAQWTVAAVDAPTFVCAFDPFVPTETVPLYL